MSAVNFQYIDKQGGVFEVTAQPGETLMEVATTAGVPGIDADCGGCCACGTCRVRLEPEMMREIPAIQGDEQDILEFGGTGAANERLGCQIKITAAFAGAKIVVATE